MGVQDNTFHISPMCQKYYVGGTVMYNDSGEDYLGHFHLPMI